MPRTLLLALLTVAALIFGAAPALAASPAATASSTYSATTASADDEYVDDVDGDDYADEEYDDEGDDACDDACYEDDDGGDPCMEDDWVDDENVGDDEVASTATDDDAADDSCDETDPAAAPAPRVSKLHAAPARHGHAAIQVRFRLDRAGDLALTLERVGAGARSSRRCAAVPPHASRSTGHAKGKRCASNTTLPGTMSFTGHAGKNATTLRRWQGKPLAPGAYRLVVTPVADGAISAKAPFVVAAAASARH